jgi:hypothetical protein
MPTGYAKSDFSGRHSEAVERMENWLAGQGLPDLAARHWAHELARMGGKRVAAIEFPTSNGWSPAVSAVVEIARDGLTVMVSELGLSIMEGRAG